ncbi:MAG: XrtA/PEP-CTERM system histidine kinase PrsK, partial [Saccharospirillum sp.]
LLAICLSLSLVADVLVYAQQLFSGSISTLAWQMRTASAWLLAVVLLIGTLLFRDYQNHRPQLQLSRPVFFYSASVLFTLGFVALAAIGGSYVKLLGGFWTGYLYTLFSLIVLFLAAALFVSKELRQRFEVMASKHFFNQKYDYRQEWLTLIRRLSDLDPSHRHYHQQLLSVICAAVKSNAGALWINSGPSLSFKASTMNRESLPREVSLGDPFLRVMVKHVWIFVPHTDNPSLAMYNDNLPDWVREDTRIWIMAPLINQMKMTGFVILEQPIAAPNITFEDLDLLTNVCTQIASHIRLHEQEKLISEGQQMETYHRLSAFIMHDVNNVVAQLDLLHRNAERHKANPAFIDDMIKTVAGSVRRMQGLMSKFNPAGIEDRRQLQVLELLRELVTECSDRDPKPELLTQDDFSIDADRQKFMLAIKNLIRNAQDATQPGGRITLSTGMSPTGAPMLSIKDT